MGELLGKAVDLGDGRPYVLEKLLGDGGMGEVYLATRVLQEGAVQRVAMKVVRRDLAAVMRGNERSFLDEARLHQYLKHPNVVRVLMLLEQDDIHYLMMEYLEGESLYALFRVARSKGRFLSEAAVCHIFAQVADALDYVHQAKDDEGKPLHIVHRDVSPSNVFLTRVGEAKLMDFGVAWSTDEERLKTNSQARVYQGKLPYLSPEQANRQPLDGRSDLFALGCMLVEALTGVQLFRTKEAALTVFAIRNVTPEYVEAAIKGVSKGLKAICHRLLAREPSARFSTAKEVAEALRAYARQRGYRHDAALVANEMAELERLPPLDQTQRRWSRRIIRMSSVFLAVSLTFAAASLVLARDARRHEGKIGWRNAKPPVKKLMPSPSPVDEAPPSNEKKLAAVLIPGPSRKPRVSAATCWQALQLAGVILTASSCQAHVTTHTRTGDCSFAPARKVEGKPIPELISVRFASLNGEPCQNLFDDGTPNNSVVGPPLEPCPVQGDGAIVLEDFRGQGIRPNNPEWLRGARFYGQAYVREGEEMLNEWGQTEPRKATGRLMALLTEMRLPGKTTTVPICGVLYDADDRRINRDISPGKEGTPVLDPEYHGVPSLHTLAGGRVKLYWPK